MSQFEFIAVFVAIIFGLSLTQILSGMIFLAQRRVLTNSHLGWTLFVLYVLSLNWWTFWPWSENPSWSFDEFFLVLLWATAHYAMASTLYPSRSLEDYNFEDNRKFVAWAFIVAAILDAAVTATRGDLFDPWYYLVFIGYMNITTSTGVLTRNELVHRYIPWFLLASVGLWSFIVRRFLD